MERGLIDWFLGSKKKSELKETPIPIPKEQLEINEAYAIPYTNRRAWSDFSVLEALNPKKLAHILRDIRSGECPAEYLELAQDIELKDLHYRSVISTRKDAVCKLKIKVTPASDDQKDLDLAEHVRQNIVENTNARLRRLIRDMLDALAKGFSVTEIIWDTSGTIWKPKKYEWKDTRWFQYDKESGKTLMLRDPITNDLYPLSDNKFLIHEPHLISGNQIISGLALPALFYIMLKTYDVTSWAAFIDRYGFPIRLGKYGKKATNDDIQTLKRAIASIGADFGAVIPDSAIIEIVESKMTGDNSEAYQKIAVWVDKQISKLVLGQTMTTDEGSSRAQSQVHDEVRDDIANSDTVQIIDTLNTQLVVPFVRFNFGEQNQYPKIELYKPDEKNIEQVVNALDKLGRQGLKVKADEVRTLLGLTKPEPEDEVIGGIDITNTPDTEMKSELNHTSICPELNTATKPMHPDSQEKLLDEYENDYIEISEEIATILDKAAEQTTDFESFKAELEKLVTTWKPDRIAELMALAFFTSRATGDSTFAGDE